LASINEDSKLKKRKKKGKRGKGNIVLNMAGLWVGAYTSKTWLVLWLALVAAVCLMAAAVTLPPSKDLHTNGSEGSSPPVISCPPVPVMSFLLLFRHADSFLALGYVVLSVLSRAVLSLLSCLHCAACCRLGGRHLSHRRRLLGPSPAVEWVGRGRLGALRGTSPKLPVHS
jgi:hypothetical protein